MLISPGMKDLPALAGCRAEKQPGKQKKKKLSRFMSAIDSTFLFSLSSPPSSPSSSPPFCAVLPLSCSVSLHFQCMPGYVGTNCSDEINECFSLPCQNGGTCIDLINTYKCSCPRGTQGQQTPRALPPRRPALSSSSPRFIN